MMIRSVLRRSLVGLDSKPVRSICTSAVRQLRKRSDDGGESDSEKWLRYASDTEGPSGGNISAFEDEEGNLIRPTGELTKSIALRKIKRKSSYDRVGIDRVDQTRSNLDDQRD